MARPSVAQALYDPYAAAHARAAAAAPVENTPTSVTTALMPNFIWGPGGQKLTKEEIARQRAISDALKSPADYQPTGPWSLAGGLASDLSATFKEKRADEADAANKKAAAEAFAGLADGADTTELMGVLGNEDLSPPQSAVAQALFVQKQRESSPDYQADLALKQAQAEALGNKAPDYHYVEMADPDDPSKSIQVAIDPNDPTHPIKVGDAAPPKSNADPDEISAITDAIISGQQPPDLKGMYGNTVHVRAELAKKGYDLTKAQQDFAATTRLLATLNGPQQVRLRQAVAFTKESLPGIQKLADEWNGNQFPALNRINLEAAKQGAYGQDAASLAVRLESQIADLTSELGTVYKGGNSSTDESLRLAAENLKADWSQATLADAIKQIETNLTYRENSLNLMPTAGIPDSNYNPMTTAPPAGGSPGGIESLPTATNPQTGEQLVYVNGQWIPVDEVQQ